MKQSELNHILKQHKLWLESNGNKGKKADLTNADLWGADLTEANLTDANLSGANLTAAYLTNANLTNADLTDANLYRANLHRANLTDSTLNSKYMAYARVDQSQLSWLATDPNFYDWVDQLDVKKEAA